MTKAKRINCYKQVTGSLSAPSKMPCSGFSIPAHRCKVGSILRKQKNSVCGGCYALKGRYVFPNVLAAMENRYSLLIEAMQTTEGTERWIQAMTDYIKDVEKSGYFRWHDSGDLQSIQHLQMIAEVARRLPSIQFWIPTREITIVKFYCIENSIPENLTVRISAPFIGTSLKKNVSLQNLDVTFSAVLTDDYNCPSSKQGNKCIDCRKCWDKSVREVSYGLH